MSREQGDIKFMTMMRPSSGFNDAVPSSGTSLGGQAGSSISSAHSPHLGQSVGCCDDLSASSLQHSFHYFTQASVILAPLMIGKVETHDGTCLDLTHISISQHHMMVAQIHFHIRGSCEYGLVIDQLSRGRCATLQALLPLMFSPVVPSSATYSRRYRSSSGC